MKRFLLLGLLVLPLAASAQAPSFSIGTKPTGPIFTQNLVPGSTGEDVLRLQQYLNTHGCLLAQSGPGSYQNETTYFGPLTKASLQCFQKDTGLIAPTGNLGPLTREYISTLP